jgi:hypothetical protein
MNTPFDQVIKLTEDIANISSNTTLVLKRVIDLEEKSIIQQGLVEICLDFISSKYGKEEYMSFLKSIPNSQTHSKEAKLAASLQIHQEDLWGKLLKDGKAQ